MREKWNKLLPLAFLLVFALSRVPGMLPQNFSAAYALAFCAGVYFAGPKAWWLPLGVLVATDVGLNFYYMHLGWKVWDWVTVRYQLCNYVAYALLILFGRRFKPQSSFLGLLGGGILGALMFYLVTNTASWFFNPFKDPEYTRDFQGWLMALFIGTKGWPQTWEFFRNTLLSGGLFTALFVAAAKLTASAESRADKVAGARAPEAERVRTARGGQSVKLGIISDTHGFLDPSVAEIFKGVDHILHAGDVGPYEVLLQLQAVAPVTAVLGNTDMFLDLKLTEVAHLDGRKFMIHHIVDPHAPDTDLMLEIASMKPHAVIFGHTHKRFFGQQHGTLYLNPGYAGRPKPNQERTVAIIDTGAKELCAEFFTL